MKTLDFQAVNRAVLAHAATFFPEELPGGAFRGQEYVCANINGGQGRSFSINIKTGAWADFSDDIKGGDTISFYAAKHGLSQGDAVKRLASQFGIMDDRPIIKTVSPSEFLCSPPEGAPSPKISGYPEMVHKYHNADGRTAFYVARYNRNGKKSFKPYSWDNTSKSWLTKAFPEPRPLYNLHLLAKHTDAQVIVVEGETSADAINKIVPDKIVAVTWPNGANSVSKADLSPLHGRNVVLWPDADAPGNQAMEQIASKILGKSKIKVVDTTNLAEGYDAANLIQDGFTYENLLAWIKPRVSEVTNTSPAVTVPPVTEVEFVTSDENSVPQSIQDIWANLGLVMNKRGPENNALNIVKILHSSPLLKGKLWYDDFHRKIFTTIDSDKPRPWTDSDEIALLIQIQDTFKLNQTTITNVAHAAHAYAKKNRRNEVKEWLSSLTWDGVSRLNRFFVDVCDVNDTPYSSSISCNFWISLVARVFQPGCKADCMIILEGPQGTYKSSLLKIIGGNWYSELTEPFGSKDFYGSIQGKLLIEVPELDSLYKSEVNTIKKVLSATRDTFRPPYGRNSVDMDRIAIFAGTTNDTEYLKDLTGSRRFWPVETKKINLNLASQLREQYFAEAVHLYKQGSSWHLVPEDEAELLRNNRTEEPVWVNVVERYLQNRQKTIVTIDELLTDQHCINMQISQIDTKKRRLVAASLKSLGWRNKVVKKDGSPKRVWVCKEIKDSDLI